MEQHPGHATFCSLLETCREQGQQSSPSWLAVNEAGSWASPAVVCPLGWAVWWSWPERRSLSSGMRFVVCGRGLLLSHCSCSAE